MGLQMWILMTQALICIWRPDLTTTATLIVGFLHGQTVLTQAANHSSHLVSPWPRHEVTFLKRCAHTRFCRYLGYTPWLWGYTVTPLNVQLQVKSSFTSHLCNQAESSLAKKKKAPVHKPMTLLILMTEFVSCSEAKRWVSAQRSADSSARRWANTSQQMLAG